MSGYSTTGAQGSTGQTKEEIRQKAEEVKEQAQQKSAEAMEQARESTRAMLDQQKGRAAQGLGSVASALRQTGENLGEGEQDAIGQYARQAADKIDAIANQLQDRSVDEILYEAERFARREPEIFLGGAVVLGLLAARFLKASGARRSSMRNWEYGSQYPRYGYGAQGAGYTGGQYGGRYGQYGSRSQYGSDQLPPSGEQHGQGGLTGSASSGYTRPASGYTQSGGGMSSGSGTSGSSTTGSSGQTGTAYGSGAKTGSARGMGTRTSGSGTSDGGQTWRKDDTKTDDGGA